MYMYACVFKYFYICCRVMATIYPFYVLNLEKELNGIQITVPYNIANKYKYIYIYIYIYIKHDRQSYIKVLSHADTNY